MRECLALAHSPGPVVRNDRFSDGSSEDSETQLRPLAQKWSPAWHSVEVVEKNMAQIFREVADEMEAEGQPVPVPPDHEDDERDAEFWVRVDRKLSTV